MIISSEIISAVTQVDGRIDVTEMHTHDNGSTQVFNYLADNSLDLQTVANIRAGNINAEVTKRANEAAAATNFEIPLTDVEIMKRITPTEWAAFQASTNENISYFRAVFAKTRIIHRNDPFTTQGFNALVAAGILTSARVTEVLA